MPVHVAIALYILVKDNPYVDLRNALSLFYEQNPECLGASHESNDSMHKMETYGQNDSVVFLKELSSQKVPIIQCQWIVG